MKCDITDHIMRGLFMHRDKINIHHMHSLQTLILGTWDHLHVHITYILIRTDEVSPCVNTTQPKIEVHTHEGALTYIQVHALTLQTETK